MLQRNVLTEPGIGYHLCDDTGSSIATGARLPFFCASFVFVAATSYFLVKVTAFTWAEDGGGSVDEYLYQDEQGLEKANG
jgi:hypothetical protein